MSRKGTGKRSGRVGSFFFGSFIGFIFCIALIAGLGCFAYFKVSPAWLNKTFKTDIDLGSDEANNKTLKDFVSSTVGLVKNVDTYTLSDLKGDFGIEVKDELFGLDITDLKSVGIKDLPDAIEKKFGSISADELRNINGMNLDDMSKILDKTNTYYFNSVDNKLYENFDGTSYSNPVDFDYDVNEDKTKVITKKHETTITLNEEHGVVNQVNIQLWYLPLTKALGGFTSNMGNQITLAELEDDYGVELPSFLDNVDKQNTTINGLEDAINDLYVADFLGYTVDDSNPSNLIVKDADKNEVTGLMYELAIETVEGLKDIESKFSSLSAIDLEDTMDLSSLDKIFNKTNTYFVNGTKLYEESSHTTEVDFEYKIEGSNIVVEGENFAISAGKVDIGLKYLPLATAISSFTDNLGEKLTLQELENDYGVILPEYITKGNGNKTINKIEDIIDSVYIADILGYTINGDKVINGLEEVKGVMAIVAKEQVGGLSDIKETIDKTKISEILDINIKLDSATGVYYDDINNNNTKDIDEEEVAYVMNVIAGTNVEDLSSVINGLKVSQIFTEVERSEGILSLIEGDPTIEEIPAAIESAIETATVDELIAKKVIDKPEDYDTLKNNITTIFKEDNVTLKKVYELTLPEMIDYCFDLINAANSL